MQLYALDQQRLSVFAGRANKQVDYICIECQDVVRLRGGIHRQEHFYHLKPNNHCRMHGKGMVHLKTQLHILNCLPEGDGSIEYRFPEINRIADVVWVSRRIVFEVQCAAISAEEVQARNRDYRSQGWQPIWILHDNRYNQHRISAAEAILRTSPHYFTDINIMGQGHIYDQFDIHSKGFRKEKMEALPIDIAKLFHNDKTWMIPKPKVIYNRLLSWPCYFEGDLLAASRKNMFQEYIVEACQRESKYLDPQTRVNTRSALDWLRWGLNRFIVRPYSLWFQMLLERMCR